MAPPRPDLVTRIRRLAPRHWLLLAEAALALVRARILLTFVPFRRLAPQLGRFVSPEEGARLGAAATLSPERTALAREIGWAVRCAARYVPVHAVCLPQAIAAQHMLRRRGIASIMHFGAGRGVTKPLDAHAWLETAGVKLTGYPVAQHLAEIACFI